ncbi:hypothetical protein [Reyranella sp.]|uniref:hypothetical protein n=1 Tax=Reyranella sp. TaxID=1929291 RepID=UPI003BACECFA
MARLQRRTMIQLGLGGGLLAGLAGLAVVAGQRTALGPTDAAGFHPVPWPFAADAWPDGRAWASESLDVYVRLKQGLCSDCETGIVSDEAVDRAVDIDRLDPRFRAAGPGQRVRITDLFGRARLYRHRRRNGSPRLAEGIVVAYRCDLVVAIVDGNMADPALRRTAHRFLESNTVQVWVNRLLESG